VLATYGGFNVTADSGKVGVCGAEHPDTVSA